MDEVLAQALADAELAKSLGLKDDELKSVEKLSTKQVMLEDQIEEATEQLKVLNRQLEEVRDRLLPDAMLGTGNGVTKLELSNGCKITLSDKYLASYTKANEQTFFEWLKEMGDDGIINADVTVPFGKGSYQDAVEAAEVLKSEGYKAEVKGSIHWATLRSFARELKENNHAVPEFLNIHKITSAKITRPKKKG
jgi:hypothetical protein